MNYALEVEKFKGLFEMASSAMALLKGENFVFEVRNSSYHKVVGEREVIGKTFVEAIPEIKDSGLPEIMRRVWETGKTYEGKELLVPLNLKGKLQNLYFDFSYSRLDIQGEPYGIIIHATDVTEKILVRKTLEDSQRKLTIALESAQMGTWDLDPVTNKVIWSSKTNELFGVDPMDDFPLGTAINQIHPDDRERVTSAIADAINPEKRAKYSIEYRVKKPDGSYRWLNVIGRAYFEGNNTSQFTGIAHDITEEKNRDFEYQSLANSIPLLNWMADGSGNLYWYNERWLEYTGLSIEEMKDWGWAKVMDPDLLPEITEHWLYSLKHEVPFEMSFPLRRHDGTFRWFLTRAVPIRDESGKVVKWFGSNTDVDDRVRAERELAAKSSELVGIIENMEEGLILGDRHAQIRLFNPAALRLHGFKSEAEVIAKLEEYPNLFELSTFDGRVIPLHEWPMSRMLRGERVPEMLVKLRRTDTKKTIMVKYSGAPLLDENGKLQLVILNVTDITRNIETQEALERALEARDEFLSVASHELKTPLTALIMQSQLQRKLQQSEDPRAFDQQRISRLFEQYERLFSKLNRLIEDMLDISRIQTGKLNINKTESDFCKLVEEVLERLSLDFQIAGCGEPDFDCPHAIFGHWDALRIEQVITNLFTNAIRYGKGKPVSVTLRDSDSMVTLIVKDQGIGIAPEDQEKIFERFERVVNPSEVSGFGLGLYISRQIVREHGGTIRVESKPGEGSAFYVTLPKS